MCVSNEFSYDSTYFGKNSIYKTHILVRKLTNKYQTLLLKSRVTMAQYA